MWTHQQCLAVGVLSLTVSSLDAWTTGTGMTVPRRSQLFSSDNNNVNDDGSDWLDSLNMERDSNRWRESTDTPMSGDDWLDTLESKKDGSFWNTFEPSAESDTTTTSASSDSSSSSAAVISEEDQEEAWLDTLAALSAEEVEFNQKENEKAEMARKMEEWNFSPEIIEATVGVATTLEKEQVDAGMQAYMETTYEEEIDMETVESHTTVEVDEETGEPVRQQMVYVDEHTCIGCTNCAMVAQSTFFMHSEHGRARVFQQWGDDDETVQVAIETCPVDCIHYVPYDELVRLEEERRDQNINFKARLVSQGEYGGLGMSHRVGGANGFTAPQEISGNASARCNNCPSRGCRDCPMFGVGKNPEYERREKERLAKRERNRLQREREAQQKKAEL